MRKAISFCVWGDNSMYYNGIIENLKLRYSFYKDWDFVIHYNSTVPNFAIEEFKKYECVLINQDNSNINPYFWRFLTYDNYNIVIYRDADSRISNREELAVQEWIESNKRIHVMRDHPCHVIPYGCSTQGIMAGMWGIKNNRDFDFNQMVIEYNLFNKNLGYGSDQAFLLNIYNLFIDDLYIHDEFYCGNKFPISRENFHFIGEKFDGNNIRDNSYKMLIK